MVSLRASANLAGDLAFSRHQLGCGRDWRAYRRGCGSEMRGEEHRRPSRWDSHTLSRSLFRPALCPLPSALCALSTGAERWGASNNRLASLAGLVVLGLADPTVAACFITLTRPWGPVGSFSKSRRRRLFMPRERHRDNDALSSIAPARFHPQDACTRAFATTSHPSRPSSGPPHTPSLAFASGVRAWTLEFLRESWPASISRKGYLVLCTCACSIRQWGYSKARSRRWIMAR